MVRNTSAATAASFLGIPPTDYEHALLPVANLGFTRTSRVFRLTDDLVRRCDSQNGAEAYGKDIAHFLAWCIRGRFDPLKVTTREIGRYASDLSGYAPGTKALKLTTVRLWYRLAIEDHLLRDNPARDLKLRAKDRTPVTITPSLSRTQVGRLLASIAAEFGDPRLALGAHRDYTLITTMIRLALRATETASLRWGNIVESDGRRRVDFLGKGQIIGHLLVPTELWLLLLEWKRTYELATGIELLPADPVFPGVSTRDLKRVRSRRGTKPLQTLGRTAVYQIVMPRLRDIEITGRRYGPHCLRATAAVLAYYAGATIVQIQLLLRHSSVQTTMRYLQSIIPAEADAGVMATAFTVPEWSTAEGGKSAEAA